MRCLFPTQNRHLGDEHQADTQYLSVYVGQIRQKLEDDGEVRLIVTEPGVGYRFRDLG